jgi:aerobic-type carbon monoxide dehydrogenase small subunit (CoxS/CutS family)
LTIEGVRDFPEWENMHQGIKRARIHLCPYCAPARALSIVSLLLNYPAPDENLINDTLFSVNCTCTGYQGLRKGILYALEERESPYHA